MKRSGPLRRRTPLRQTGPIQRSAGAPLRSPSRKRRTGSVTPETAQKVIRRDGSCRAWSLGFALDVRCSGRDHVHHRRLRSQGGSHDAENLLLLCDLHHRLAHDARRADAERSGVILRADAG